MSAGTEADLLGGVHHPFLIPLRLLFVPLHLLLVLLQLLLNPLQLPFVLLQILLDPLQLLLDPPQLLLDPPQLLIPLQLVPLQICLPLRRACAAFTGNQADAAENLNVTIDMCRLRKDPTLLPILPTPPILLP
ncbi:hypothetical protein EDC04DRAFT_2893495 [Pisolithus marmoratus]|nr:hypothetical protein EDC04DRAFT_2893495 [Pisolithus marmoratus]